MNTIHWHTFALHTAQTRTLVHFFPSAGSMTAPYPAQCRLTAFGEAVGLKSVTLDGGRVSQPDGICVEDVFPALQEERSTAIGLTIEVSTMQPRLDISPSDCVVEFVTDGFSTRFHPYRAESGPVVAEGVPLGMAIRDRYTTTSIFIINTSEEEVHPDLMVIRRNIAGVAEPSQLEFPSLSASSVREVSLSESHFQAGFAVQQPYGLQQYVPLTCAGERNRKVVLYNVYRDASTGCPVSVCAL